MNKNDFFCMLYNIRRWKLHMQNVLMKFIYVHTSMYTCMLSDISEKPKLVWNGLI